MRISGGMFGLEFSSASIAPAFMREPKQLLLTGRCGIKLLVDGLKPAQVWMPSYLCCSMLDPVDPGRSEVKFFEIGYDLQTTSLEWLDQVQPGSLVILIDYFGFPCDKQVAREARARGAYVLDDASQALLSGHVGSQADYVLYSPRKTVGVPDGGILRSLGASSLPAVELMPPPRDLWLQGLKACVGRREFDRFGGDRSWFELFRQVEVGYPVGPYRMSELSEMLLEVGVDYAQVAEVRRANYTYLAESLGDYALFKRLDAHTVPLGFPIRVPNRDKVRQFLFDHAIYPPIHWELDRVPQEFAESHRLSADIMTIPCDQRLEPEDIMRTADLLHSVLDTAPHIANRVTGARSDQTLESAPEANS
jgi:hypothetical protein